MPEIEGDVRIKTRRDIIDLTVLNGLDRAGVETTWRNRMRMLRNVRDELMFRRPVLTEDETETLKEVVIMLNNLKSISARSNL